MNTLPEAERRRLTTELERRLLLHAPMTEEVSVKLQLGTGTPS